MKRQSIKLASISDVYVSTMVRVLFHMLREVKILTNKNELQSVLPSNTLLSLIERGKNDAHLFFNEVIMQSYASASCQVLTKMFF